MIVPNEHLETPHYTIERIRYNDEELTSASYTQKQLPEKEPHETSEEKTAEQQANETPVVSQIQPSAPPPPPQPKASTPKPGLLTRLWQALFAPAPTPEPEPERKKSQRRNSNRRRNNNRNRRGGRDHRQQRNNMHGTQNAEHASRQNNTPPIKNTTNETPQPHEAVDSALPELRHETQKAQPPIPEQTETPPAVETEKTVKTPTETTDTTATSSPVTPQEEAPRTRNTRRSYQRQGRYAVRRRRAPQGAESLTVNEVLAQAAADNEPMAQPKEVKVPMIVAQPEPATSKAQTSEAAEATSPAPETRI